MNGVEKAFKTGKNFGFSCVAKSVFPAQGCLGFQTRAIIYVFRTFK